MGTDPDNITQPVEPEYRAYQYDPIGNRAQITEAANTGAFTANNLNQYTGQAVPGDGTRSFDYDADGNLISLIENGSEKVYTWNAENRLTSVAPRSPSNGDKKVEFIYDYMGRRVKKSVYSYNSDSWLLTSEFFFIYDGWNLVEEITEAGAAQSSRYFVWGQDLSQSLQGAGGIGGLIAALDGSADYLYCFDANGNVGQVVNAADGAIAAKYEYDPYGKPIHAGGDYAVDNPFRFSTKYFDAETELYYYGYRYYSVELGRWISRDPLEETGGANLYLFVFNNSNKWYDSNGNYPLSYDFFQNELALLFDIFYQDFKTGISNSIGKGIETIKDKFRQWNHKAKFKESFAYDLRTMVPEIDIGIFKTKVGGVIKGKADGCCIKVSGGLTLSSVAKSKSFFTPVGGISLTGGPFYQYCWASDEEKWSGSIGGIGFFGFRGGIDATESSQAYAEGGIYASYDYSFETDKGKLGLGGYARSVFEFNLKGVWQARRQYKWTYGDSDVHF